MNIHEWCIAVLKGRVSNTRISDLYNLCTKHCRERIFDSEDELLAALELFNEYFCFEDFRYDYVTFDDDGQKDSTIIELAKDVLRSHSNRYTLSVLCRKMNETGDFDTVLDDASLKALLSTRNCFTIEPRSFEIVKLSAKGEEYDVEPIELRRPSKSKEEKEKEEERRRQHRLEKERERLVRKSIKEEEKGRKRLLKQKKAEHKVERLVEKVRMIIAYYQISDKTTLEELWADKLIRKDELTKCENWGLYTVGQVYAWVESRHLTERQDDYRKRTMLRMLKIASFHDPEIAYLIPNVKFSGIQKANRGIKLAKPKREANLDPINVQLGDVLRWNYTKEEGVVVGFDYEDGERKYIVQQNDGKRILFEDDPKLFEIVEREKEENVNSVSNEMEVEHVFLDSHGKIINSIVTSTVDLEGDEASK